MTLSTPCLGVRRCAALALLLTSFLALGCGEEQQTENKPAETALPEVGVYTVKVEPTPIILNFPGRVIAKDTAEIRPQINGLIEKVCFDSGDLVHEGDVLYKIDSNVYEANLLKAQANLDNLVATEQRLLKLREKDATSEREVLDATAARKQGEAELNLAKIDLDHCQITATMDGVIDGDFTSKGLGELVAIGQPQALAVIRKIDPIKVEISPSVRGILQTLKEFSANESERDDKGADDVEKFSCPTTLVLEDGSIYAHEGALNEVASTVQEDLGTVKFRALFPNPDRELLPGMFVHVNVTVGNRENGILLPPEAVFRDPKSRPYVWVVTPDSKIERRNIETTRFVNGQCLVDSGLNDGERVVTVGSQYVYEGCEVKVGDSVSASQAAAEASQASEE